MYTRCMRLHSNRILYEDDHLIALNKLGGDLVVRGSGKLQKLPLLDILKEDYKDVHALHRLDLETSGVVLFAKSADVHQKVLDSNFDGWEKIYRTLVMGRITRKKGVLRFSLPARNSKGTVDALTRYSVLDRFANSSYVEAEIETGRHHQIRKHFAEIRHPLVLDREYGHKKFNRVFTQEFGYKNFFLHAYCLRLPHPISGENISIESPIPKAFADILEKLHKLS